jgi:lipid-A-disaccharide synthase
MSRRVFITVAEVSGDLHASHLIQSLRQLDPEIQVEGLGGEAMRWAGATIHHETVAKAAMGVGGLTRVGEVLGLLKWTRRHYRQSPPDLHICVDSPAMNFHFAKLAHGMGIPVLYYIAPQLWAWREGRMRKLQKWVDHVACILPFEEEYFRRHGVKTTFVGHPLFDELPPAQPFDPNTRFPHRPPVIGLLPGSRRGEAESNYPHMLQVGKRIKQAMPEARFLTPTTPATTPVVNRLAGNNPDITIAEGQFDTMVPQCDLCITVSGTATLHVAGHGTPMIVVYRTSRLMWNVLGRWIVRTRTYSLVNLLADSHEHIVPEFVPWYGSNDAVYEAAMDFLQNPLKLEAQRTKLKQLIRSLDKPGASHNAAKLAIDLLEKREPSAHYASDAPPAD